MQKYLSKLNILYLSTFLFGAHMAFLAYFDSSFLETFVGKSVGVIYSVAAFLSLIMLDKIPQVLSKFGNRKTTLGLLSLDAILLCGIVFLDKSYILIPLFIIHNAFLFVFIFSFDIFLEHYTADNETGDIRGKYLTIGNIAWVLAPSMAGFLLGAGGGEYSVFKMLYLVSALLLLPVIAIIYFGLRDFQDKEYHHPSFWRTIKEIQLNHNIYKIFMVSFLLQFFFSWMGIYIPIYLHEQMGFGWDKIGYLFTIMLLPYVIFTIPAGKLADTKFGEKEILSVGFIIAGVASAAIAFINSSNFFLWAAVMFTTRIGGSFIDVMNETYFFKHVSDADANIISFFRNAGPLAYIISPVIATIFLGIFPSIKYLFLFLGLIMLIGLKYSMTIRDTR